MHSNKTQWAGFKLYQRHSDRVPSQFRHLVETYYAKEARGDAPALQLLFTSLALYTYYIN